MRLNFAGVPEEEIREGIRRIGRIMGADTGMFGALTGPTPAPRPVPRPAKTQAPAPPGLADVVELPRRRAKGR